MPFCLSAMTTEQLKTQSNNIIHKKKKLRKNRDHLIYKITFILHLIKSVTITMPKENYAKIIMQFGVANE